MSTIALSAVALSALSISPLHAGSVNCDAPGQDLQKKIDTAEVGDELFISGVCDNGPYRIFKALRLTGDPSAILSAPIGGNEVVATFGANVEFSNLVINADLNNVGFHIIEGSAARFNNVIVEDAHAVGINIGQSSSAFVSNSEIRGGTIGIQLVGSSAASIFGNLIEDNKNGIIVSQFSSAAVDNNVIVDNRPGHGIFSTFYGFVNTYGNANTIERNGTDIRCEPGGSFVFQAPQNSSTKRSSIDSDCRVTGVIFAP